MEENTDQPKVIYSAPNPFYTKRIFYLIITLIILTLLEIFLLGYYGFKINIFNNTQKPVSISSPSASLSGKTIKESELPMAVNILQNPMVYEWRGSVEGTLVAKDEKSITLEKDEGKITLPINPSPAGVKFYTKGLLIAEPTKEDSFLSIDKIPIGTRLRGEFWVFPDRKEQLFTGSFTVVEQ